MTTEACTATKARHHIALCRWPIHRAIALLIIPNLPYLVLQSYYAFDRALINLDYLLVLLLPVGFKLLSLFLFWAVTILDFSTAIIGQLRIDIPTAAAAFRYGIIAGVVRNMSSLIELAPLVLILGGALVWKLMWRLRANTNRRALVAMLLAVILADALTGPNMITPRAAVYLPVNLAGSAIVRAANEIALHNIKLGPVRPTASAVAAAWNAPYQPRLLLVVVESWGMPAAAGVSPFLIDSLLTDEVRQHYGIRMGSVAFRNSTSGAELRELCGLEGAFVASVQVDGSRCLPARLRRAGFLTKSIHGYFGSFYNRTHWYPRLGFAQSAFLPELILGRPIERRCGAAFRGLCDSDVADLVAEELHANRGDKQFVYWLTLSSHVPVSREAGRGSRYDCRKLEADNSAELCNMFRSWEVLFNDIARIITDPALPPTEIIIVGDHKPPFVKQEQADLFSNRRVPWVALSPREIRR